MPTEVTTTGPHRQNGPGQRFKGMVGSLFGKFPHLQSRRAGGSEQARRVDQTTPQGTKVQQAKGELSKAVAQQRAHNEPSSHPSALLTTKKPGRVTAKSLSEAYGKGGENPRLRAELTDEKKKVFVKTPGETNAKRLDSKLFFETLAYLKNEKPEYFDKMGMKDEEAVAFHLRPNREDGRADAFWGQKLENASLKYALNGKIFIKLPGQEKSQELNSRLYDDTLAGLKKTNPEFFNSLETGGYGFTDPEAVAFHLLPREQDSIPSQFWTEKLEGALNKQTEKLERALNKQVESLKSALKENTLLDGPRKFTYGDVQSVLKQGFDIFSSQEFWKQPRVDAYADSLGFGLAITYLQGIKDGEFSFSPEKFSPVLKPPITVVQDDSWLNDNVQDKAPHPMDGENYSETVDGLKTQTPEQVVSTLCDFVFEAYIGDGKRAPQQVNIPEGIHQRYNKTGTAEEKLKALVDIYDRCQVGGAQGNFGLALNAMIEKRRT